MKQLKLPLDFGYYRHPRFSWDRLKRLAEYRGWSIEYIKSLVDEIMDEEVHE